MPADQGHGPLPPPVERLWEVIRDSAGADDPAPLFSPGLSADLDAVRALAAAAPADFPVNHVLGWFYWQRYLALDGPADQEELACAATYLAAVRPADPQAVPEPLRELLAGSGDRATVSSLGALMLRRGRATGDLASLDAGAGLLRRAADTMPATDPWLPRILSNLAAGYVTLYERTGDLAVLDAAIDAGRGACQPGDDEEWRPAALVNLSAALLTRYERSSRPADLAESVDLGRAGAASVPAGDPAYASSHAHLGNVLRFRYRRAGAAADLDEAIAAGRAALRAALPGDDQYSAYASGLASSLVDRFEQRADLAALTEAISLLRDGLAALADSHPAWPRLAANLSNALRLHYELCADAASFEEQVTLARRIAADVRDDDPGAAQLLSVYANSLRSRYDREGDEGALREAIAVTRRAMAVTSPGERLGQALLGNYGSSLWAWYERSGDATALQAATGALRRASAGDSVGGTRRASYLTNLATALQAGYERSGETSLLEEAAAAARTAAATAPREARGHATHLSVLGNVLLSQYEATADSEYLDAAEEAFRLAVAALPRQDADRASFYANLANALMEKHERTSDAVAGDEAVTLLRRAVAVTPGGHAEWTTYVSNLAISLFAKYRLTRETAVLDEAIALSHQALAVMSPGQRDRGRVLSNLGYWLRLRYEAGAEGNDLNEAASAALEGLRGLPDDHPYRCTFGVNLGAVLRARYRRDGDAADLAAAIGAFRDAAQLATAPPTTRLIAARQWAGQAADAGDWPQAVAGFRLALDLLAQAAPRRLARADQEHELAEANGLASDAAASALQLGDAALAVRWLEQGRGLLLAQALETRVELTDLRLTAPALAGRFEQLRDALDAPGEGRSGLPSITALVTPSAFAVERRRDLVARYADTVQRIRALPGFSGFLSPPSVRQLLAEAAAGPIVMVNISQYRCDALALTPGGVVVVPLTGLTADEVTRTASAYLRLIRHARSLPAQPAGKNADAGELLRQVLRWLWDKIAEPVLETLGYAHRSGELPRLWWCPAGLLGLLPLHAAQRYDPGSARDTGVIDRVVPSYTPTVRALNSARSLPVPQARAALVVSAPGPLAGAPLRGTSREAQAVAAQLPARVTVLGAGQATVAAVRDELGRHSWLHFAGHSRQNLLDPGRAALLLDDGELTVLDITRLRLPGAELAFLSSCEGGLGSTRLPDEAIHLASALQVARYREVIAALWSIGDNAAADIAGEVYRELALGGPPAQGRPAVALHRTLRRLRDGHSPLVWAAYCHTGP